MIRDEPRRHADAGAAAAGAAPERVRFVGEAVAFVVAETAAQAKDAAEAVDSTSIRCRR